MNCLTRKTVPITIPAVNTTISTMYVVVDSFVLILMPKIKNMYETYDKK